MTNYQVSAADWMSVIMRGITLAKARRETARDILELEAEIYPCWADDGGGPAADDGDDQ